MNTKTPFPYSLDSKEGWSLSNLPPEDQAIILQKEGGIFEHAYKVKDDVEEVLKNNQNELKRKSSKIEELERNLKFQTLYSEIIILINTASEDEKEELDKIFYGIRQSQDRNAYEDLNNLLIKFSIKTNNQNLFNKLLTVPEAGLNVPSLIFAIESGNIIFAKGIINNLMNNFFLFEDIENFRHRVISRIDKNLVSEDYLDLVWQTFIEARDVKLKLK